MPSFLQRWWVHVLVSSGGQHPQDIDYRARGLLQPYESLKAATPGPARARNKEILKDWGVGWGENPQRTVFLTPLPALLTSPVFYKSVAIISKHYTNTPKAPRSQQRAQKQR